MIYRKEKGSPLTSEEVDGNFRELVERMQEIEAQRPPEGIGKITIENNQIHIQGDQGTNFGKFDLPRITWTAKGVWQTNQMYHQGDVITHQNSLYCCGHPHHSHNFSEEQDHWKLLFTLPEMNRDSLPPVPLYETATIPHYNQAGQLALVINRPQGPQLAFSDGEKWRYVRFEEE